MALNFSGTSAPICSFASPFPDANDCRFGKLRLHGRVSVGKDRDSWQDLECYLFTEMLICVKEKKNQRQQYDEQSSKLKPTRCTLKGSILIKRHLNGIDSSPGISKNPYHFSFILLTYL